MTPAALLLLLLELLLPLLLPVLLLLLLELAAIRRSVVKVKPDLFCRLEGSGPRPKNTNAIVTWATKKTAT